MVSPSLSSEGVRAEDETVCSGCVIQVEWIGNCVRLVAGFHVVRVEFVGILVEQWPSSEAGQYTVTCQLPSSMGMSTV